MPNLPIPYQQQVDPRSGRTQAQVNVRVPDDMFGQRGYRDLARTGEAIQQYGDNLYDEQQRALREKTANNVANFSFAEEENRLKTEANPDADDYLDIVESTYRDSVERFVDTFDDDNERTATRAKLLSNLPAVKAEAGTFAYHQRYKNSELQANAALGTLANRIQGDPTGYAMYVQQGEDVLDARPNLSQFQREAMRTNWRQDSAKKRFDGLLDKAQTIQDVDALAAEIANTKGEIDWTSQFRPQDYSSTVDAIATKRKVLQAQYETVASGSLKSLNERIKADPTGLIPVEELQNAQETVRNSGDINKAREMATIMRQNQIARNERMLPPAELEARVNAYNGDPGLPYPNIPPELATPMNEAATAFGLPVDFFGGSITREYGGEFAKAKVELPKGFTPQTMAKDLDLRNIDTATTNALTFAGQSLGKPLLLVKSEGKDVKAATISTVGMSAEDKGRLVTSLVDTGFTGFKENEGSLTVQFMNTVPKDFGERDGKFWGGWGTLSPEVAAALKAKNMVAGMESSKIARATPEALKNAKIDYGKSTQILGADGKPTSSAEGLLQFTKGTFLDVMKRPGNAEIMGVDISKMSDAQILELRKDPRISILATGAYAASNKKILEAAIGRPATSAELYMAHFLGPDGATTLLNAYKNNPAQDASALLPDAAKSNPNVFTVKGQNLTVAQVYGNISRTFSDAPDRITFQDNEFRKQILAQTKKELKENPIGHAGKVGSHTITPLDEEGGFTARGQQVQSVADYYSIPMRDIKPFTPEEENYLKGVIDSGDDIKTLQLMASIQSMGGETASAAMKQLEQKDPVFAYAGDLFLNGQPNVSQSIIRGRNKLVQNPALASQLGINETSVVTDAFSSAVGSSLNAVKPAERQSIQDAALAYWIQQNSSSKVSKKFDAASYKKSVMEVLGGEGVIDDVNGAVTLMPKGIKSDDLENAFTRMTLADWTRMSVSGKAPLYADGKAINPSDIGDEVMLRAIGNGEYIVMLNDGDFLQTDEVDEIGTRKRFVFKPTANDINAITNRPRQVAGLAQDLQRSRESMMGSIR